MNLGNSPENPDPSDMFISRDGMIFARDLALQESQIIYICTESICMTEKTFLIFEGNTWVQVLMNKRILLDTFTIYRVLNIYYMIGTSRKLDKVWQGISQIWAEYGFYHVA